MLGKIYGLTGLGLVVSAVTSLACLSLQFNIATLILTLVVAIALCVGVCYTRGLTSAGLYLALTVVMGAAMGPTINHYLNTAPLLIPLAALMTGILFTVLTLYVFKTGKDFTFLGGMLFMALVGLIIASLVAIWFPAAQVALSFVGVLIFSGYVLYDTSNIVQKNYDDDQYARMALDLYLDIVNLFLDILRILGWFTASSD